MTSTEPTPGSTGQNGAGKNTGTAGPAREIRLCWSTRVDHLPRDSRLSSEWLPDTPDARKVIEDVSAYGNEVYGPDTHWLEEREV